MKFILGMLFELPTSWLEVHSELKFLEDAGADAQSGGRSAEELFLSLKATAFDLLDQVEVSAGVSAPLASLLGLFLPEPNRGDRFLNILSWEVQNSQGIFTRMNDSPLVKFMDDLPDGHEVNVELLPGSGRFWKVKVHFIPVSARLAELAALKEFAPLKEVLTLLGKALKFRLPVAITVNGTNFDRISSGMVLSC